MIDGFEYEGQWWLVNQPDEIIFGKVEYNSKDGTRLAARIPEKSLAKYNSVKPYIILGKSNDRLITLYDCKLIGARQLFGENRIFDIYAEKILIGVHFHSKEEMKFKAVYVNYSYLDEWIDINSFSHSYVGEQSEIIRYDRPNDITINIDTNTDIIMCPIAKSTILSRYWKKAFIEQQWKVRIEKKQEASLEEFLEIIKHLQTFLCLAIRDSVHVLQLEAEPKIEKDSDTNNCSKIEIYYQDFYLRKPSDSYYGNMLFSYQDIVIDFNNILKTWFEKMNILKPICGLYFGILVNPYLYPENLFLSLVQAIEGFHRRVNKTKKIELDKRICELIGKCGDIVPQLLPGMAQDSKTINITRQHLTHYDEGSDKHAAEGKELLRLIYKLKVILEVCLVMQMGMKNSTAKELFSKHRTIREEASGSILS